MTNLAPDLVLERISDVKVRIDSSNNVQIYLEDAVYNLGLHGLAVLDAFHRPVSVSEALEKLSTMLTGAQDWIALTNTIVQLYDAGILQDENQRRLGPRAGKFGFGAPGIHIEMLNDRRRTSSFLSGIAEVVRPGDVVVDIGTGTGVLAMAAARAGAEHVFAIETSAIGEVAQEIFEANGLADRITLLRGWSTRLSLPERADVLISEIIGNEPLAEQVLETTTDARKRLLKPDARLVPVKVQIFGLPVSIPDAELTKHTVTTKTLQDWRSWYGLDFSPLADVVRDSPPAFFVKPQKASGWEALSDPVLLAEVDLRQVERLLVDNSITVTAGTSGQLNGLLVYFELELGPTVNLSTRPVDADPNCSWRNTVWVLDPLSLQGGDRFKVTYQYRATGRTRNVAVARV